jgi:hypothetical protein
VPDDFDQTFAELSESVKNRISHRARALLNMREFLLSYQPVADVSGQTLLDQQTSGS